jgi:GGDEF domain-containing protein
MFKATIKPGESSMATEDLGVSGRMLTLFAEGAAMNMPEIETNAYKKFRQQMASLALQVPDRATEQEKLLAVRQMVQEFETYRNISRDHMRERLGAWRALTSFLLKSCLERMQMKLNSPSVQPLLKRPLEIMEAEEIKQYMADLQAFLEPPKKGKSDEDAMNLATPNLSMSNDNAAGLMGGGSAVSHLERILSAGGKGYIAQFELGCLDVIGQRFGMEAVQDCLIAVAAYITHSLHGDDMVYHWSNSRLLAILQGRANEQILTAELNRLAGHNRDFMVQVGGRTIMLRIPLSFEIIPISRFTSAEDLYKLQGKAMNR